jgi:hypothetical protein
MVAAPRTVPIAAVAFLRVISLLRVVSLLNDISGFTLTNYRRPSTTRPACTAVQCVEVNTRSSTGQQVYALSQVQLHYRRGIIPTTVQSVRQFEGLAWRHRRE